MFLVLLGKNLKVKRKSMSMKVLGPKLHCRFGGFYLIIESMHLIWKLTLAFTHKGFTRVLVENFVDFGRITLATYL